MRIISGYLGGLRIVAPRGLTSRPTTDRTREAVFNVLAHMDAAPFEGARIIDLFAGSGALGFEAMSRGGAFCLFVETDAAARGALRENIEALALFGATRIHRRSAASLGAKPAGVGPAFTLAFLDPPYRKGLAPPTLDALRDGLWLAPDAMVVVEQAADEPPATADGFEPVDHRTYGDTQVSFLRRRPDAV